MRIAIGRFRQQYRCWPTGLPLGGETYKGIEDHLIPGGYEMLTNKLSVVPQVEHHQILSYDYRGNQYDYSAGEINGVRDPVDTTDVDRWIWAIALDCSPQT